MALSEEERERIIEEERLRYETRQSLERKSLRSLPARFLNSNFATWFFQGVVIAGALFAYHRWEKAEEKRREDAILCGRLQVELRARLRPLALSLLVLESDLKSRESRKEYAGSSPTPQEIADKVVKIWHEADQPQPATLPEFQEYGLYSLVERYSEVGRRQDEYPYEPLAEVAALRDCVLCIREVPSLDTLLENIPFMAKVLSEGDLEEWSLAGWHGRLTLTNALGSFLAYPPRLIVLGPNEKTPTGFSSAGIAGGGGSKVYLHVPDHRARILPPPSVPDADPVPKSPPPDGP
jgi:hypothetical protein